MSEQNVALQNGRKLHAKIYILNFKMQKTAEISGLVLDGATFTNDATSDIRRVCSISLIPDLSKVTLDLTDMNIWIDKYIQIYLGIEDNITHKVEYTNMGVYLISNPEHSYDATNNTLTLNGNDMMCKLTGLRNGYLEGIEYQVPSDSDIRNAMISAIQEAGITKYSIESPQPTPLTPFAVNTSVGSTVYDLITQLSEINANYQTYFDVNGTFRYNRIPSGKNEQIRVDDKTWEKVLISYTKSTNFEDVKNYVEVYGKTDERGNTPYGIAKDENPQSPFYYKGTAGIIRLVCTGDEYDNIYTSQLAQERANYELYLHCKLQDSLTLTCVPLFYLDVNWLIEITLPNKLGQPETNQYIIKQINTTFGTTGTQDITLMRYYPLYP